jgi:Regulator of Vps4 activity in the MVB pathway
VSLSNSSCTVPLRMYMRRMLTAAQLFTTVHWSQQDNCVHDKVITKLSVEPPTSELVQNYLIEIAAASNIDWKPRVNLAKL